MAVLLVVIAVLGLLVGSFLTVVVDRVPRGESLRGSPRGSLRPMRLGARRNPLLVIATAVIFVAVTWRLDTLNLLAAVPAYLYFTAIGIALAVIDVRIRRLPNRIVLPSYPALGALLLLAAAVPGDWWSLARAGAGAAAVLALYFILAFLHPAGMGWGDVKLAGIIGLVLAYLSWSALAIGTLAGFLLGALYGVALIATRRGGRKTAIPFGPFMLGGALVAMLAADRIARLYVDTLLSR